MKKASLFILIFALVLSLIMPFSALSAPEDKTSSDETQSSSETECEHSWTDDKDGTSGKHCELCNIDYCEVNGHTIGTKATCTKKAVCKICDDEFGNMTDHSYTDANDCTAKVTCNNCGVLIKAGGNHDWQPATCTKVKTCKTCGATDGNVLIHRWGEGTVTKSPTVTTNGSMRFVCEDCGLIKNQSIYYTSENEASPIDSMLPIIIIAIALLVITIIIVVAVIIKRSRK